MHNPRQRKEKDMKCRRHISIAAMLVVTLCGPVMSAASADDPTWDLGRLGAEWWQQTISIPTPLNPLLDTRGTSCMIGQRGDVWFLHGALGGEDNGATVERTCVIPTGKRMFFPIANLICLPFPGETIQQNARAWWMRLIVSRLR